MDSGAEVLYDLVRIDHAHVVCRRNANQVMSDHGHHAAQDGVDILERGAARDGAPQVLDQRMFMQLLVFEVAPGASVAGELRALTERLAASKVPSVVYEDVNHPRGLGALTWSVDPAHFVGAWRAAFDAPNLLPRPAFTMLGRTYSTGYEADLKHWLIDRSPATALDPANGWAVWYPLRRTGAFNRLDGREQGGILREHGAIGRAYGAQNLAHDIRLACHGLDASDNEFVIGLIGAELFPLSHVVQAMRKTRQTAEFMEHMGPFFVGRVAWRSAP